MSDTSENSATGSASGAADTASDLDPKLLEILVCPVTRGPLVYDRKARELVSKQAGLAFPIREGVPIMLPEEARQLDD
ncbi:Trm112 family protein [Maricaulaceae bacterium MS644]